MKKNQHKDYAKRIIVCCIFIAFFGYFGYFLWKNPFPTLTAETVTQLGQIEQIENTEIIAEELSNQANAQITDISISALDVQSEGNDNPTQVKYLLSKNQLILLYIVVGIIAGYFLVAYGIHPFTIPYMRIIAVIGGISLICVGQGLPNNGAESIFIGDFVCLLGCLSLILFPTNLLVTQEIKEKKEQSEQVIIEA